MIGTTRRFHAGELSVQKQAGVAEDAARLEGMLERARLDGRMAHFLSERTFAAFTSRDSDGELWTVPLLGSPGFLQAEGNVLDVTGGPAADGPLGRITVGSPAGLIVIDFPTRRRFRINGTITELGADRLRIEATEAFGNCPSYIQDRALEVGAADSADRSSVTADTILAPQVRALLERSDTFFLGTVHPDRGADTSHKGGNPGFVRVEGDGTLWWPDYSGNNMFNSLGNLTENPEASLLFLDWATGEALHLSGTATLEWTAPGVPGDDDGTGRRIHFRPTRVIDGSALLHAGPPASTTVNPALR